MSPIRHIQPRIRSTKSEIRNKYEPPNEINSKREAQIRVTRVLNIRALVIGICFGFRVSDFGFQVQAGLLAGVVALALGLGPCVLAQGLAEPKGPSHITTAGRAEIFTALVSNVVPITVTTPPNSDAQGVANAVMSAISTNSGAVAPTSGLDMQSILARLNGANLAPPAGFVPPDFEPVTWLGVATDPVSEELRAQLPISPGTGLWVRHVSKDSPALQAGLRVNDILLRLDDQVLANDEQLRVLVQGKNGGDVIRLTFLRKGKETQAQATLQKRKPGPGDRPGQAGQIIDLGAFDLDLSKVIGRCSGPGKPIIFQRVFTTSGTNQSGDAGKTNPSR
jgi:membrane-associated protease RseP (regulator of RpoE activity)